MKNLAIALIALGLAMGVTIPKLYKMSQIRGWVSGAKVTQKAITQKWHQTPAEHPEGRDVYWIAWTAEKIRSVGNHRMNVPPELWNRLNVGDQIEGIRLHGDPRLYLREGIFASDGNFAVDVILLIVEIGVAATMIASLFRRRNRATKIPRPAPHWER